MLWLLLSLQLSLTAGGSLRECLLPEPSDAADAPLPAATAVDVPLPAAPAADVPPPVAPAADDPLPAVPASPLISAVGPDASSLIGLSGVRLLPLSGTFGVGVGLTPAQTVQSYISQPHGQAFTSVGSGALAGPSSLQSGGRLHFPMPPSADCRYWCRDPFGRFYCCQTAAAPPADHRGQCPPPRLVCPSSTTFLARPQPCASDKHCGLSDKCCYDACLQQHVCKPAE
ncbi:uncharacterized protein LOC119113845 [Pollicipes pollicipes]|uniref:uncharacterized protein LOC119113845 n=1 Tax=Pollicipes pollicipes TaxID=41117 RepID=UPI001884CD58|nr:uncharacterized protein LOC119113845 [Pollicipes pollicipes]